MKVGLGLLTVASSILLLSACGPAIRSGSHKAAGTPFPEGLTFMWDQESDRAYGDPRLEGNRFFEDRLHEAIEWELALRGIRRTDSSVADLRVHHHLSLTDRLWQQEIAVEGGYTRIEEFAAEEGSVIVHLVDVTTGREIWVGWAMADVDAALVSPDAMRSWVYAVVGEMFEPWPEAGPLVEP